MSDSYIWTGSSSGSNVDQASAFVAEVCAGCGVEDFTVGTDERAHGVQPWVTRYLSGLRAVGYDLPEDTDLRVDRVPPLDVVSLMRADEHAASVDSVLLGPDVTWSPAEPPTFRTADPYTNDVVTWNLRYAFAVAPIKLSTVLVAFTVGDPAPAPMPMPPYVERGGRWSGYAA